MLPAFPSIQNGRKLPCAYRSLQGEVSAVVPILLKRKLPAEVMQLVENGAVFEAGWRGLVRMVTYPLSSSIFLENIFHPKGGGTAHLIGKDCHSSGYILPVGRVTVSQRYISLLPQPLCPPELSCQVLGPALSPPTSRLRYIKSTWAGSSTILCTQETSNEK